MEEKVAVLAFPRRGIPDAFKSTPAFQQFLMAPGVSAEDKRWEGIKKRVVDHCSNQTPAFVELACALAKYDFYGAPSNWGPKLKHERTIKDWTRWAINGSNGIDSDDDETMSDYLEEDDGLQEESCDEGGCDGEPDVLCYVRVGALDVEMEDDKDHEADGVDEEDQSDKEEEKDHGGGEKSFFRSEIASVLKDYRSGLIPDACELMLAKFT